MVQPMFDSNLIEFPFQDATVGKVQCKYCHAWIDDDALFCCRCGSKQETAGRKQKYAPKKKYTKVPLKTQEEIALWQKTIGTPEHDTKAQRECAYRNFVLFTVGVAIGLRVSDLVLLKVKDFTSDKLYVIEKKTGKGREVMLSTKLREMVMTYADAVGLKQEDYLFWQYGHHDVPMTPGNVNDHIIRRTAKRLGLDQKLYGSHTLRKTYAYQFYVTANAISKERGYRALSILCKVLNHSSEAITLRYIGIDEEEISEICGLTMDKYNMDYDDDDE